jgi:hypothetical protein
VWPLYPVGLEEPGAVPPAPVPSLEAVPVQVRLPEEGLKEAEELEAVPPGELPVAAAKEAPVVRWRRSLPWLTPGAGLASLPGSAAAALRERPAAGERILPGRAAPGGIDPRREEGPDRRPRSPMPRKPSQEGRRP